jgi:hypothetical protein
MRHSKQTVNQQNIAWSTDKVLDYLSQGYRSYRDIAQFLHVAHDTIDRNVRHPLQECKLDNRNGDSRKS